jgi:hypothetical protein
VAHIANHLRDELMTAFRWAICDKLEAVLFPHQAEWMLATDGLILTDQPAGPDENRLLVRLADESIVARRVLPRVHGRAHVAAALASFKTGKSWSAALWGAGFGAVPNARIKLIGLEYDTCAPEFEYIVEFLLSDRGMGMKYDSLQNRPRDGRMWLDLENGARYEARSWERKDGLKGKEDDAYIFCEAYQLPGLEAYTDFKQNLDKRNGYAILPTTPDRPWVEVFHQHGHGDPDFPTWQCICGAARSANPYTFSQEQMTRDRKLMTKEKFGIAYEGRIGRYVGSVFNYQRGQRQFSTETHPDLWRDVTQPATLGNFLIPRHWDVLGASDTGGFTSGLLAAIAPDGDLFFFYEQPNYRYIGGRHEFDEASSIPVWKRRMRAMMDATGVRGLWADQNSQFKREFAAAPSSIALYGAKARLEQRTDILREYFQHDKVWLAPWLEVLPYELEQAQWPEETTAGGRFQRFKKQDHTLDCAEHIAAQRPRSEVIDETDDRLWIERYTGRSLRSLRTQVDPHLGVM